MKNNILSIPSLSYWSDSVKLDNYSKLQEDKSFDVAVVGGGITGITTAYFLKNEGMSVALIDAGKILNGTSAHTTAKITSQHSLIYDKIKRKFGHEMSEIYANANETAIKEISNLVSKLNIDCDFSWQPAFTYIQDEKNIQKLYDEVEAAKNCGIMASFEEKLDIPINIKGAVKFENQAQFHPLKYLKALVEKIQSDSCEIYENTRVMDIQDEGDFKALLTNTPYKIKASKVVICSHFPCYDGLGMYFTRIYPERSYIIAAKIKEKFPEGMYINIENPTRSMRACKSKDMNLVLFGGENHKTGQSENTLSHYENLAGFANDIYSVEEFCYRWSAQDYTTMDEIPYIGKHSTGIQNIFVATGFGKWGMTNSMVAALIFKDIFTKGSSHWSKLYDPTRFTPIASAANFIKENTNVAGQFILGKLESLESDIQITIGEGKVVNVKGSKIGVYKDKEGKLHYVNTTCTHLGCELKWNPAEVTWDCPCHGSRFSIDGVILDGPAKEKLE